MWQDIEENREKENYKREKKRITGRIQLGHQTFALLNVPN